MWKIIEKYPVYEINHNGDIRNKITNKILKPKIDRKGYVVIGLYMDKKKYYPSIHRLVALTFIKNDDPVNKPQVNHIDGNKLNNHISNLEWCSGSANIKHALETKLYNNSNHLILIDLANNNVCKNFISIKDLARYLKISPNILLPYIKRSKQYPFQGRYIIEIKDEARMNNLVNTHAFGRLIYAYDYVTRKWTEFKAFTTLSYHTGLRCQSKESQMPYYRKELGFIISYKKFKVTEILDPKLINDNRDKYYSLKYKPHCKGYVLYAYNTKQEFKFKTLQETTDFINNSQPVNIVYNKATVSSRANQATRDGFNVLIKGYGITSIENYSGKWREFNLENILCSKYNIPICTKCYELIFPNGNKELVFGKSKLLQKLGLPNINIRTHTTEDINKKIKNSGVTYKRLNFPI